MIDKEEEYEKMASVEEELWWYRALHLQVYRLIKKHKKRKDLQLLDAGCGTGGLIDFLRKKGYTNLQGLDLSEPAIHYSKKRNINVVLDDVRNVPVHFEPEQFDIIVCNDVLCYFSTEEQVTVIKALKSCLKKDGILVMNLPALRIFSGIHDISVGIKHRFSRPDVRKLSVSTGTSVLSSRFWPVSLSPVLFLIRWKQRLLLRFKSGTKITSDVALPVKWLNRLLTRIVQLEVKIPASIPFGSSLFVAFIKSSQ